MAILSQTLVTQSQSALDAEGFDRYEWERDFRPAVNYAKDWLVTAFNRVFSQNKLSEEILRELIKADVFITSLYSRIAIDYLITGRRVWSIMAVYPEITYAGTLPAQPTPSQSVYCPSVSYLKSYYSAKRKTFEGVNKDRNNPFAHGNEIDECPDTKEYAYVAFANYNNSYSSVPVWELEILPEYAQKTAAVVYLYYPPEIINITDSVPFPESLTNLMVAKILDWISFKQGDNTNLKGVSDKDIKELITLMT